MENNFNTNNLGVVQANPNRRFALFDDLVGGREQGRQDTEAERLGSLEIEHKFKLRRLHHRHVRGVRTFENLADVQTGLTIHPADAWPVTQQSTGDCELTHEIYGGQGVPLGEGDNLFAAIKKDRICRNEKRVGLGFEKFFERDVDLVCVAGLQRDGFKTQLPCAVLRVRLLSARGRIALDS